MNPEKSSSDDADKTPNFVQCLDDLNATRLQFQTVTYVFIEETSTTFVNFEPTLRAEEFGAAIEGCFVRSNVSYTRESLIQLLGIALEKAPLLNEMLQLQVQGYALCKNNADVPEENKVIFSCDSIQDLAIQYAVTLVDRETHHKKLEMA